LLTSSIRFLEVEIKLLGQLLQSNNNPRGMDSGKREKIAYPGVDITEVINLANLALEMSNFTAQNYGIYLNLHRS